MEDPRSDPGADVRYVLPAPVSPPRIPEQNPFSGGSPGSYPDSSTAHRSPAGSFPDASCESVRSLPHLTDPLPPQNENS